MSLRFVRFGRSGYQKSLLICSLADVTSLGCAQACPPLGSGKSGSRSLLETKTEIVREKSNSEFRGTPDTSPAAR